MFYFLQPREIWRNARKIVVGREPGKDTRTVLVTRQIFEIVMSSPLTNTPSFLVIVQNLINKPLYGKCASDTSFG